MSVALFIVPERQVDGVDTSVDGKALGHAKHLDRLAKLAGVKPLHEFFSVSPGNAMAVFETECEEPVGGFPPEHWFSAADGLVSVRGLLTYITANSGSIENKERVVEDLRQFESVLDALKVADIRWHLSVDY